MMGGFYTHILEQSPNSKKNTIWYSAGMLTFSVSSIILLLSVTRISGSTQAGKFSIGWAICQQMVTVGYFGSRNFQIADWEKKFSFRSFLSSKTITIALMIIGTVLYTLILQVSFEKIIISFLLVVLMVGEVLADLFAGVLQLNSRLELSGKSYVIRVLCYDLIFVSSLWLFRNLFLSLTLSCFVSFLWLFLFDYQLVNRLTEKNESHHNDQVLSIIKGSFPIFISAFLTNYLVNIPKNAIELFYESQFQTIYNVLFMPTALVTMFSSFILVPLYTTISEAWVIKNFNYFNKLIIRIIGVILFVSLVVVFGGYFIGIPVLSIVYNLNLSGYRDVFVWLLIAGGLNSLANFLVFLLTVLKRQNLLLYIYAAVAIIATFFGNSLVKSFGLQGAAAIYLIANFSIVVLMSWIIFFEVRKNKIASKNSGEDYIK
jgi:O-antigen/teichoic acid export membrane protein